MDEQPSELERLAKEVTDQGRRDTAAAKVPQTPPGGAPQDPKKQVQDLKHILVGLFVFIGGGCWGISLLLDDGAGSEFDAKMIAQGCVRVSMKFPEEVSFPWVMPDTEISEDGVWTVSGGVVGKNAFGVRIRYVYECRLKLRGGSPDDFANWELLHLSLVPQ